VFCALLGVEKRTKKKIKGTCEILDKLRFIMVRKDF